MTLSQLGRENEERFVMYRLGEMLAKFQLSVPESRALKRRDRSRWIPSAPDSER